MPLKAGYGEQAVRDNIAEMERAGHPRGQSVATAFALARKSFFRHYPGGALPAWLAYPKGYRLIGHYDKHGKPLMIGHSQRLQRADIAREYNENPDDSERRALLREYNSLKTKAVIMQEQLEKLEARTGRFGRPIAQEKQIAIQEELRGYTRRLQELRKMIYPNAFNKNPAPRAEIQKAAKLFEDFTGRAPDEVSKINLPETPKAGLVFGQLIRVGYRSARDGLLYEHTFRKLKSRPLLIASSDGKTVLIAGGRYAFTDRGIEDK